MRLSLICAAAGLAALAGAADADDVARDAGLQVVRPQHQVQRTRKRHALDA